MKKTSIIKSPGNIESQNKKTTLTNLEIQCILQLMQNKTPTQIGVNFGLSLNTIHFYLMNAGQKLRLIAKNKS